eukprot:scaffold10239_cov20-Tisochrysis_lutea.AAC.6
MVDFPGVRSRSAPPPKSILCGVMNYVQYVEPHYALHCTMRPPSAVQIHQSLSLQHPPCWCYCTDCHRHHHVTLQKVQQKLTTSAAIIPARWMSMQRSLSWATWMPPQ